MTEGRCTFNRSQKQFYVKLFIKLECKMLSFYFHLRTKVVAVMSWRTPASIHPPLFLRVPIKMYMSGPPLLLCPALPSPTATVNSSLSSHEISRVFSHTSYATCCSEFHYETSGCTFFLLLTLIPSVPSSCSTAPLSVPSALSPSSCP